jgi:hypothetical protein
MAKNGKNEEKLMMKRLNKSRTQTLFLAIKYQGLKDATF